MKIFVLLTLQICLVYSQNRRIGRLNEVYAWKQLTYDINGNILSQDRFSSDGLTQSYNGRFKRQSDYDSIHFQDYMDDDRKFPNNFNNQRYPTPNHNEVNSPTPSYDFNNIFDNSYTMRRTERPTTGNASSYFIQYNNVPMGAEKYGHRLFITVPRRRYGIPSTLNYIDLTESTRSPHLKPYPSVMRSQELTSVYRTRADECDRLWMVDTGLLEIPISATIASLPPVEGHRLWLKLSRITLKDNPQQIQQPAIVIYDLRTDTQIMRYQLKESDVPANNTPTGLASITVDTTNGCADAFAYIPDLTTNGIVVFSLRDRDSWRFTHNYFHFNPTASSLNIAGQRFQWNDGIFSITLGPEGRCRRAYFHPMVSTQEFAVSTCILNNRTAQTDPNYWEKFTMLGERGTDCQSTMHEYHQPSGVIFYADIGRDGVSCWNTKVALTPQNVELLARDSVRLSYPADLHVTDNEVWVIANTLPRFGYSQLDTNEYNFFIYRANVRDLISGTRCDSNNM